MSVMENSKADPALDEILDTLYRESESDPGIDMAGTGLPPPRLEQKKRDLKLKNVLGFALSIICGLITSLLIIVKLFQQVQYCTCVSIL